MVTQFKNQQTSQQSNPKKQETEVRRLPEREVRSLPKHLMDVFVPPENHQNMFRDDTSISNAYSQSTIAESEVESKEPSVLEAHAPISFEDFEFGAGDSFEYSNQNYMEDDSLLAGVPFSDRGSIIEDLSSNSEDDRNMSRNSDTQQTHEINFVDVKNLRGQFETFV